ncbi:MAG TPA: hypothetical protein VHB98_18505 [Chloroflexota bacterium]|nr:hypothetical protein [Chloroflexota bacterium]
MKRAATTTRSRTRRKTGAPAATPVRGRRVPRCGQRRKVPARRYVSGRTQLFLVLLTGLFYTGIVALTAGRYGGNLSALIVAGGHFVRTYPGTPGHHIVIYRAISYDGLGYYYIAGNPFMHGSYIHDALRYQRIGYPLLVWLLSLGQRAWQPVLMVAVNLIAVMTVAFLAVRLIRQYAGGANVWWALACAVNPALIIGVQNDLAEPLLMALALAGLLLYLQERIAWATVAFAAALLTREVGILFLVPLLLAELAAWRLARFGVLALSVGPYLIWHAIVTQIIGYSSTVTVARNFQAFLVGMRLELADLPHMVAAQRVQFPGIAATMLLVVAGVAVATVQAWQRYDVVIGGLLVHCGAALFGAWVIWEGYLSAPRVFGGLYPLLVLAYLRHGSRNRGFAPLLVLVGLLTLFILLEQVIFAQTQPYYVTP